MNWGLFRMEEQGMHLVQRPPCGLDSNSNKFMACAVTQVRMQHPTCMSFACHALGGWPNKSAMVGCGTQAYHVHVTHG